MHSATSPAAVNVSAKTLFTPENLAKLPADKQIVSYCYSGQTASQTTAALRLLGYDAYNMQFGLPSWAIVPGVSTGVWDVSKSLNQPLVLATEATADAAATTGAPAPAAPAPAALPTTGAPDRPEPGLGRPGPDGHGRCAAPPLVLTTI